MNLMVDSQPDARSCLEAAQAGNQGAFDALVALYSGRLRQHVETRIGSHLRGRVEVDDVLQDTYTRAWKSIGQLTWISDGATLGWLARIAEHAILKLVTKDRRQRVFYVEETPPAYSTEPSPSTAARRGERLTRLDEAIDRLKPEYREALRLVRLEGLQLREAAERLERTPNAVMHLVMRALKELKKEFGDTESLYLPPRGAGDDRRDGDGGGHED